MLDEHEDADIQVYAVWFSMFGSETRENWPSEALTDPRVVHYWDDEKTVGRWYAERMSAMENTRAPGSSPLRGNVLWDAYLVYGPDARWAESPSHLRQWGRTILATQERLREAFAAVVSQP